LSNAESTVMKFVDPNSPGLNGAVALPLFTIAPADLVASIRQFTCIAIFCRPGSAEHGSALFGAYLSARSSEPLQQQRAYRCAAVSCSAMGIGDVTIFSDFSNLPFDYSLSLGDGPRAENADLTAGWRRELAGEPRPLRAGLHRDIQSTRLLRRLTIRAKGKGPEQERRRSSAWSSYFSVGIARIIGQRAAFPQGAGAPPKLAHVGERHRRAGS
jgi:hypothetical protein